MAGQQPTTRIEFDPVPRKGTRHDGWSAEKQRLFIDALAVGASVKRATQAAGRGYEGVYKLKNAPGSESFVAAWRKAIDQSAATVRDVYFDQCVNGVPEEVWHAGKKVGVRRRFNHHSMQFVLRHHMPETYGAGVRGLAHDGGCCDAARAAADDQHVVRLTMDELAEQLGFSM